MVYYYYSINSGFQRHHAMCAQFMVNNVIGWQSIEADTKMDRPVNSTPKIIFSIE